MSAYTRGDRVTVDFPDEAQPFAATVVINYPPGTSRYVVVDEDGHSIAVDQVVLRPASGAVL